MDKSVELAELELKLAKVERELKDLHLMIKRHAERYSVWEASPIIPKEIDRLTRRRDELRRQIESRQD